MCKGFVRMWIFSWEYVGGGVVNGKMAKYSLLSIFLMSYIL